MEELYMQYTYGHMHTKLKNRKFNNRKKPIELAHYFQPYKTMSLKILMKCQ